MEYIDHYASPLGSVTLAGDGTALTGLWFDGQKHFAETLSADHEERNLPVFEETKRWLNCYFSGRAPGFTPPLAPRGTTFRKAVWEILTEIPPGKTTTYSEVAERLSRRTGVRTSARAVGNAVGHNPILLIIPCHRVVGAGGSLTGYAGGIERKILLLKMEQEMIRKDCP